MSCIHLDKQNYQYVADTLAKIVSTFNQLMPFHETRGKLGYHLSGYDWDGIEANIIKFVVRLQSWNLNAFYSRYPDKYKEDFMPDFINEVKYPNLNVFNLCQFLKILQCIDYQCSDSDGYEKSKEKDFLHLIIAEAQDHIISELPQYESAKWLIEPTV